MKLLELYRMLGLPPGAGIAEIKEAYRKAAKRCHPDTNPGAAASDRFAALTEAYQELLELKRKRGLVDFPVRNAARGERTKQDRPQERNIFVLGEQLLTASSATLRAFAARSLGNSGKVSAYIYLRKALFDKDPLVVKSAVRAVGQLRILQSAGELASVFSRGDAKVRLEVLHAVRAIGRPEKFSGILSEGSRDKDPEVSREAFDLLGSNQERRFKVE